MPILDLQRRMREIGRIRIGAQVEYEKGGKTRSRPAKLETFRLTSQSRELIDAAAEAYGGEARPWQNGDRLEFEVVTETAELDIVIPPGEPVTQWNELWRAGGCIRRCDGVTNIQTDTPCECPQDREERARLAADGEACKATTRLSVMLPALPDLGVWRLESHGYYAATELAGAAEVLAMATATGRLLPARLRLEQRTKKRPGQPTLQYAVPIIEFTRTRMAELPVFAGESGTADRLPLGRPAVPALPETTLPATSDMRAPMPTGDAPLERPLTEPEPEVAQVPAPPAAASAAPDSGGRATCGAPSVYNDADRCNMPPHPYPAKPHRLLDATGKVTATW